MKPYIPHGCDQQGRYPHVAEAANELCTDDEPPTHGALYWLEEIIVGAAFAAFVGWLIFLT